jgi:undecaprenyl phosphate N,N'-diacetylbacillosamine 1-phosphate transferase
MKLYKKFLKRIFDFLISLALMLLLLPVFLVVILVLFFANKGAVFFLQARPGKRGEIFKVIKFKTMSDRRDVTGNLLPDEKRLTEVGKFIRRTSLDEIPQLLNVIKGDMSLIGPRPLLPEYLPLYSEKQSRRHDVRPGITGWAQVNGRNAISWEKKFEYDVWYTQNVTFLLDMKILWLTAIKVFKLEDINSSTSATMERFNG